MKRLSLFAAAVLTLGLALAAVSDEAKQTHLVARGPLHVTVDVDGAFDSPDAFEARFRPDAYAGDLVIAQIAEHGKAVKKGDVLVRFDPSPFQKQIAGVENDLRGAQAALKSAEDTLKFGEEQDKMTLENAQIAVTDSVTLKKYFDEIDGPHMLRNNELGVQSYEDWLSDQQEELDQLLAMYKSEELTTATADIVVKRSKRQIEQLKERVKMTKESAKKTPEFEFPKAKDQAEKAVLQAKISLEQTESNCANNRVQRETTQVRARIEAERQAELLDKLKKDLDRANITSPIDGWAFYGALAAGAWNTTDDMMKALKTGEKAVANTVILTVVPRGNLAVRVAIPEAQALMATKGQKVSICPAALPDEKLDGQIGAMSAIPVNGTYAAWISIAKGNDKLVAGMKCKVTVEIADLKDAVLVPLSALGAENGKPAVWVEMGGKEEAREVTTGLSSNGMQEIKTGLKGGETILLNAPKK